MPDHLCYWNKNRFTLSREEGGVDSGFSLEPDELEALVVETHRAWESLGSVSYGPTRAEQKNLIYRRSIYVAQDIAEGDAFTSDNIRIILPGDGAPPHFYEQLLGRTARRAFARGTPLTMDYLL